jgi:nucleotide-binding universal stress UspA family protein
LIQIKALWLACRHYGTIDSRRPPAANCNGGSTFMYKKILVPVDLAHPDSARHVAKVAKSLAETGKSEIVVLNVVPAVPGFVAAELPSDHEDKLVSRAMEQLKALTSDIGIGGPGKTIVRSGRPHNEILEVADEMGADLIVVGSHQPGLQDYLLGSVAGKVVRHAKCSVFVDRSGLA